MFAFSSHQMYGHSYPQYQSPVEEGQLDFGQASYRHTGQMLQDYQLFDAQPPIAVPGQQQAFFEEPQQFHQHTPHFQQPLQQPFDFSSSQHLAWIPPTVPSDFHPQQQGVALFSQYSEAFEQGQLTSMTGYHTASTGHLSPEEAETTRPGRATSLTSTASSVPSFTPSDLSRSVSPNASEMAKWV